MILSQALWASFCLRFVTDEEFVEKTDYVQLYARITNSKLLCPRLRSVPYRGDGPGVDRMRPTRHIMMVVPAEQQQNHYARACFVENKLAIRLQALTLLIPFFLLFLSSFNG